MILISRLRLTAVALLACSALSAAAPHTAFASGLPRALRGRAAAAAAFQVPGEYVKTYAADCVTPQTTFYLGDTVCAEAGGYPLAVAPRYRRFQWVAPNGSVVDLTSIKLDPQSDALVIPTAGDFAQVGTWYIRTVNWDASVNILAKFVVRNSFGSFADLSIRKWGPSFVLPGYRVSYTLTVENPGPDFAKYVDFTAEVPDNMTFVAIKQASGPLFECSTPAVGGTGTTICKGRGLGTGEAATFVVYYTVSREARDGSECVINAKASSLTEDLGKMDNYSSYVSIVGDPNSTDSGTGDIEDP